jgi:hypothetical protein
VTQKTANVRDYVGYVDHFFLILHFLPNEMTLAMLCILLGKRQDEYRQFFHPEEKYTI